MTTKIGERLREIMRGSSPRPRHPDEAVALEESPGDPSRARALVPPVFDWPSEPGSPDATPQSVGRRLAVAAARALGGAVHDTPAGPCVIVDRIYDHDHLHGLLRIGDCACHVHHDAPGLPILAGPSWVDAVSGGRPCIHEAVPVSPPPCGDIVFLDLETTGLAGGAGTYAFLIGCGWFEAGGFRVRQYFMVGHALERALLSAVRERLECCGPLVTYNGKSYDQPLLETRFRMARTRHPFDRMEHLDLLHGARRLWKLRLDSCRLVDLVQRL